MTLVVGYDGTSGARAALDEALDLAGELGDRIVLVFSFAAGRLGGEVADLDRAIAERGRAVLEEGIAHAKAAGVDVDGDLLAEGVVDGLVSAAERHDARMIVVGSYGERPLKGVLVGSTPYRLLHLSAWPVLVVRADA